jgi:hypothetical protein
MRNISINCVGISELRAVNLSTKKEMILKHGIAAKIIWEN